MAKRRSRSLKSSCRSNPGARWPCASSGRVLTRLRRPELAQAALRKTIAVDPWRSDYHLALAQVCAQAGDLPGAIAACQEAIRLNPELIEARSLLVQCYLHSHEPGKADAEFRTLVQVLPRQPRDLAAMVRARKGDRARWGGAHPREG